MKCDILQILEIAIPSLSAFIVFNMEGRLYLLQSFPFFVLLLALSFIRFREFRYLVKMDGIFRSILYIIAFLGFTCRSSAAVED